jgi:uncharacterized membrane protein
MEIKTARWWYRWLWMSPLLTIPTLLMIYFISLDFVYVIACPQGWQDCNYPVVDRISAILAVIISSLWHLLLLIPSLNKKNQFVRWHGRQAMILAGVRTIVPLVFVSLIDDSITSLVFILVLIPIWFFGTYWGQHQAAHGDCSLMRWTGRTNLIPGSPPDQETSGVRTLSDETLENTFRFSKDRQERAAALEELKKRGMVEQL